ncbi:S-layer homology domain-containing protein [Demequina sp. NBRC 110056]|uniref:S-layer homology domain-containing protein n=1 Tax=Demequina sp. NBRC 110056 TaxID=1570345 RepID=UPI0009FC5430|nr:carboxypeptidase regulatory-like domain-containing protein [Demequina sp. NBRC 110056]
MASGAVMVSGGSALAADGEISGTVTLPSGAPAGWMDAIRIEVSSTESDYARTAEPGPSGVYTLAGLPDGSYLVHASVVGYTVGGGELFFPNVLGEYHDGAWFADDATSLSVAGAPVTGVNFALETGRTITGALALDAGAEPALASKPIDVSAFPVDGPPSAAVATSATVAGGTYTIDRLYPTSYVVEFRGGVDGAGFTPVVPEFYSNASTWEDATEVSLASGNASGINATLAAARSISGTISIPDSVPDEWLGHVAVGAVGSDGTWVAQTTADPVTGAYTLSALPAGPYRVEARASSYSSGGGTVTPNLARTFYANAYRLQDATTVNVTSGSESGINISLPTSTTVSGTVTLPSGMGAAWMPRTRVVATLDGTGFSVSATPQSNGSYTLQGVPAGSYRLHFSVEDYWDAGTLVTSGILPEYFDDAATAEAATLVNVSGTPVTGRNATLVAGRTLSGTVTIPGSLPVQALTAVDVTVEGIGSDVSRTTPVAADGSYAFVGLPDGDYRVRFVSSGYSAPGSGAWVEAPLISEYFDDALDAADAEVVTLAGSGRDDVDAELAAAYSISGTVAVAGGGQADSLGAVWVSATSTSTGLTSGAPVDAGTGAYTVPGLAPGDYILEFQANDYWDDGLGRFVRTALLGEYWDDAASLGEADAVAVSSSNVTGLSTTLDVVPRGSLEVALTYTGGLPYGGGFCLLVEDTAGIALDASCVDSAGDLPVTFADLPVGRDVVVVAQDDEGDRFARQYLGGTNLPGTGTEIALVAASTVTRTLPIVGVGTVSGAVTYESSAEVVGDGSAEVLIYAQRSPGVWEPVPCWECGDLGEPMPTGESSASGAFTAAGLVPGTYKVAFRPALGETAYLDADAGVPTAFFGSNRLAAATVVTVAAGGAITGADAVLPLGGAPNPVFDSGDGRLSLTVTRPVASTVAAGQQYTVHFAVSNDTGEPLAFAAPDEVALLFAHNPAGVRPVASSCDFAADGSTTFDRLVSEWSLPLAGVVEPGPVGSCTLTYTATANDVAFGGLWTAAVQRSTTGFGWDVIDAELLLASGVSTAPAVTGTAQVGKTLSVSTGFYGPKLGAAFTYRWRINGSVVSGATGSTYVPKAADAGKQVSVTVALASQGVSKTSPSRTVAAAPPPPPPPPDPKPTVNLVDISSNPSSRYYTQFYTHIRWLANEGITTGWNVGNGRYEFRPKEPISREAMAAFLYRYAGSPRVNLPSRSPFRDVPTNAQFYKEIVWLSQQGITTGWDVGGGRKEFRPREPIARDAMAAFLYRYAGSPSFSPPSRSPFRDTSRTGTQFYKEITWLSSTGISTGWDVGGGRKEFRPYDSITREAMAAFLYRYDRL